MASTADSTVPYAVITTTGSAALMRFTACRNSSPLIPGSLKSVTTRSTDLIQKLQAGFGVRRGVGLKPFFAELQLEQPPHLGFVFDDEDGWF